MERLQLIFCVLVILSRVNPSKNQECPSLTTTIQNQQIQWTSSLSTISSTPSNRVIPSSPQKCLDSTNKFQLKFCANSSWDSPLIPECAKLLADTSCPMHLIPLEKYCALVTQPQNFDTQCPDGFLKYYNTTQFDADYDYWSPTRKIDDDTDVFMHIASDAIYGKEFIAPNQRTDCFVITNGSAEIPKFCNESHHQICVVPKGTAPPSGDFKQIFQKNVEKSSKHKKLQIKLKFDRKRAKIILNIYNPEKLLQRLDDSVSQSTDAIYCFTNADDEELKTPLKIKNLNQKSSHHPEKVFQISIKHEHPGEYYCEAFDVNQNIVKSNVLIAYKKKKGNEYAARVILKGICPELPLTESNSSKNISKVNFEDKCQIIDGELIMDFLDFIKLKSYFFHTDVAVRVMQIFNKTNQDVDVILHLTTMKHANVIGEYYKLFAFLKNVPSIELVWFQCVDYCLPETTNDLSFDLTSIGEEASPNKLCLNEKAIPVQRKCSGTFISGAYWDKFEEKCHLESFPSETTAYLYNISVNFDDLGVLMDVNQVTSNVTGINAVDVYLVANILESVNVAIDEASPPLTPNLQSGNNTELLEYVLGTLGNLMEVNKTILEEAQFELNATDSLLDTVEKYFDEDSVLVTLDKRIYAEVDAGGVFLEVRPKFILHVTRPFVSNIHGIALYRRKAEDEDENSDTDFSSYSVISLEMNQTFDDLLSLDASFDDLELATYVPIELLQLIALDNGLEENITVITSVFYNDNLFNSEVDKASADVGGDVATVQSKVVSVKIPDYGLYLEWPLPLIFRDNSANSPSENLKISENRTCAYWNYGEYAENKTGRWSFLGGMTEVTDLSEKPSRTANLSSKFKFTTCYFNHLTHFALLIMNQRLIVTEPESENIEDFEDSNLHNRVLGIITITGCVLSVAGILGIFLTAICFERWRKKTGSKILLQLSLAILLEIIVIHIAGSEKLTSKSTLCTIVGISMHYVVLAKSSWMFVSAILQYLRFVKIFQVLPSRIILKAMLFAWGWPILPVALVGSFQPNYTSNHLSSKHFCYPADLALYLGLFLPVVLIVACNLMVFVLIMRSVFNPNIEVKPRSSYKKNTAQNRLQIYLGILLFFMLGIPWVFGILAEVLQFPLQLICVYLFCLFATLQGGVIFLFYVVFDGETRKLWVNAFRRLF